MRRLARSTTAGHRSLLLVALLLAGLPLMLGAGRCGLSGAGFFSDKPAPDMRGSWAVSYDDSLEIEIDLGAGAGETQTVSSDGGSIQFTVDGQPVELNLDCSQEWLVCPSEVWAEEVSFDQPRFASKPHQVEMMVSETECSDWRMPDENAGECSSDPADNMPCDVEICDPENVTQVEKSTIASISEPDPLNPEPGSKPDYTIGIALEGGLAMPTANCVLLAASYADADIVYDGEYQPEAEEPTMEATELRAGLVTIDLSGACFWGEVVDDQLRAALLSARVRLRTGFTAVKQ